MFSERPGGQLSVTMAFTRADRGLVTANYQRATAVFNHIGITAS